MLRKEKRRLSLKEAVVGATFQLSDASDVSVLQRLTRQAFVQMRGIFVGSGGLSGSEEVADNPG